MRLVARLAMLLLLLGVGSYSQSLPEKTRIKLSTKPLKLATLFKHNLDKQVLYLWTDPRLVDHENGGFYNLLDANGTPKGQLDKPLIAHLRLLWVHAVALKRTTDKKRKQRLFRQYRDGMAYLQNNFRNHLDGSWYSSLTLESQPIKHAPQTLHQIYAIYILVELKRILNDDEALQWAEETFELVDATAWDADYAGYFSSLDTSDLSGKGSWKNVGLNIHAMLALASLYRAVPKPLYRQRLGALYHKVRTQLVDEKTGHSYLSLTRSWQPLSNFSLYQQPTLFGHTAELLWYSIVSSQTLGEKPNEVVAWARKLATQLKTDGISTDGIVFHKGRVSGEVTDRRVTFWAQAEAMNLFLKLFEVTGECGYFEQAVAIAQWTFDHMIIPENGLWWRLVDEGGNRLLDIGSGLKWQAGFHETRMLLTAEQVLGSQPDTCIK